MGKRPQEISLGAHFYLSPPKFSLSPFVALENLAPALLTHSHTRTLIHTHTHKDKHTQHTYHLFSKGLSLQKNIHSYLQQ